MGFNARKVEVGVGKKSTARSRRSRQKTDFATMTIVGGNRDRGADNFLKFLKANPKLAREFGSTLNRSRAKFASAYPGQTREKMFTNDEWKAGGYEYVAELNDAMGLTKS